MLNYIKFKNASREIKLSIDDKLTYLKKVMEEAGFINVRRYDWREFFPQGYDDYSAATVPHMEPNGISLGLNIICEKP